MQTGTSSGGTKTPDTSPENVSQAAPLASLTISYVTDDRFVPGGDVDQRCAQNVEGTISVDYERAPSVPLGRLSLAVIDLSQCEAEGVRPYDVLDAQSGDWETFSCLLDGYELREDVAPKDGREVFVDRLLILDRLWLEPDVRGHGLGLHVLARAILTWASRDTLVALTPAPTEGERDGAQREAARAALENYWKQLGMRRYLRGDGNVLIGWPQLRTTDDRLHKFADIFDASVLTLSDLTGQPEDGGDA